MSAALTERLVQLAQQVRLAPRGQATGLYDAAARELGMSRATLLRKLGEVTVRKPRKRRMDAGATALTREEAHLIAAFMQESSRKNGKQLLSLEQAVAILRANNKVRAERVDEKTGEVTPLSTSAIRNAMANYGLTSELLLAPAPAIALASDHPNQFWQIDASICVLYYLKNGGDGLQGMDQAAFYKNKPGNFKAVENNRVWRYVVTDHTSGTLYVEYVLGAESGENLANIFINAIQKRPGDPFHGVPLNADLDPGSANTGAVFRNLCRSLGVHVNINKPGNPRAKGQVENAQNIVERQFESGLKFRAIASLEELNREAQRWAMHFNAHAIHTRHQHTRYGMWQRITAEQLRLAPAPELCRVLAHSEPENRTVSVQLTVSFGGQEYDVSAIPGVVVRGKLLCCRNPWRDDAIQVVTVDEHGHDQYHDAPAITKDQWGFRTDAAQKGQGQYKQHADTVAQTASKELEQLAMGAGTQAEVAAARKAKALPFGGEIDPYKPVTDTPMPEFLPKRGSAIEVPAVTQDTAPKALDRISLKLAVSERLRRPLMPAEIDFLEGQTEVTEDQVPELVATIATGRLGASVLKLAR
ncbi:MAG: DDE-type integrase/transposase/recombinase [Gammaproteobacteria bacterium]|nr:DDE-type integrase/transposase/recombinase [Gammaproteobacteria bacterium]